MLNWGGFFMLFSSKIMSNTEGVALKLSKTVPDAKAKIMFKSV